MTSRELTNSGVVPVLRDDGVVYFDYVRRPVRDLVYEWVTAFLWFLVPVVLAAVLIWY